MVATPAQSLPLPNSQSVFIEIRAVERICQRQGLHFTNNRQQVQEILLQTERPMTAYEILKALQIRRRRRISPPTIYRALHFLTSHGFASRLEVSNAYTPIRHTEQPTLFLICKTCGALREARSMTLEQLFEREAATMGFRITKRAIELQGTCSDCQTATHTPT
nr:Fur family transcriptional regulator [uncultured Cohaesibacter sp.]